MGDAHERRAVCGPDHLQASHGSDGRPFKSCRNLEPRCSRGAGPYTFHPVANAYAVLLRCPMNLMGQDVSATAHAVRQGHHGQVMGDLPWTSGLDRTTEQTQLNHEHGATFCTSFWLCRVCDLRKSNPV